MENGNKIKTFSDLDVFKRAYNASRLVLFSIIPLLPKEEKYDLGDQLRRACKSIPTLIAEGYAKKYQNKGFQKYLQDAMAEANEMIVHLSYAGEYMKRDELIDRLKNDYLIISKQLFRLQENWRSLNKNRF
jgi:four helix bundle protein